MMRTNCENHCTDFAHFCSRFPAMFRVLRREPARSGGKKALNYGVFSNVDQTGSRLDLGRFTKVKPAFFLKSLHRLKIGACSLLKMALHGFCTTFPNSASLTCMSGEVSHVH